MGDTRRRTRASAGIAIAGLFALLLSVCVMVGCGNQSGGQSGNQAPSNTPAASGEPAATAPDEATATEALSADALKSFSAGLPTGSLEIFDAPDSPTELTATETEKVDRAIRAYKAPEKSLLVNKAKNFYFKSQLSGDLKELYDVIYSLFSDPTNADAYFSLKLEGDTHEDEFLDDVSLAWLAVQYDHPEFFWAYNGLEVTMNIGKPHKTSNEYIFFLDKPYKRYENEMKAFNDAVDSFMSDIDLEGSDYQIARQIHDKLIAMVTYDDEAVKSETNDLAHTAYGALVENSSGMPHMAVCDGYSQAFVYLLQQAGIDAAVVLGEGGSSKSGTGPHAWSMVKLGEEWYEVDSTWDDQTQTWREALAAAKQDDPTNELIPYLDAAFGNQAYCDALDHAYYNLTTAQMSDYEPTTATMFVFSDGKALQPVEPTVHTRADKLSSQPGYDKLMALLPTATGTKYAYAS